MARPVPAATAALRVLRFLSGQPVPVSATHIAGALGLPRSSAYHLLAAMADEDFVVHYPEDRTWGMGIAAWEVGHGFARQEPLARLARMPLARLVDRVGQSAHLVVLHGADVLYVIEERAPGRPPLVTDVGVRLPAHLTASGRAILASLPAAQVTAALSGQGGVHVAHGRRAAVADRAASPARHDAPTRIRDRGRRGHRGLRVDRGPHRRRHDPRVRRGHLGGPRTGRRPGR